MNDEEVVSTAAHILVVDDDALQRRSVSFVLQQAGYRVSAAESAEDALALARRDPPDLILLDIGLPGMDGLQAVRRFQEDRPIPVIFVTARRRELDQVVGLELGADDYIVKPFDLDVLLARIRAVLRRAERAAGGSPPADRRVVVGDLVIDPDAHTVSLRGVPVDLPPRAFDLLHALALNAGRTVSSQDLLARVWGAEFKGEPQVVYVYIRLLREKLEADPDHPTRIVTVRGVGYRLEVPDP